MQKKKKNCSVINYVNKINTFRNIQQEAKKKTDRLMAGIIQATQDFIQGLTVSAGALHTEPEIIFQLCFTSNHKTNYRTKLQGTG